VPPHASRQGLPVEPGGRDLWHFRTASPADTPPARRGQVMAAYRARPFVGEVRSCRILPVAGGRMPSIAEIVAELPEVPAGFIPLAECRVNGMLVPREAVAAYAPARRAGVRCSGDVHAAAGRRRRGRRLQ